MKFDLPFNKETKPNKVSKVIEKDYFRNYQLFYYILKWDMKRFI